MRIFGIHITRLPKKPPASMHGDLDIRHTHAGKIATTAKVGTELHRDTNTWQYRERHVDKAHPHDEHSYTETIINPTTGDYIVKDEKYAEHKKTKGQKR